MKIKDILKNVCAFLTFKDALNYLENNSQATSDTLKKVNDLTRFSNIVISELAAGYIPMTYKEVVSLENGKLFFSNLTFNATKIISVTDKNGEKINYTLYPAYAKVDISECTVEYEYAPANYGLNDDIGFNSSVASSLLAYGVAAEYCISEGRFEEGIMWRKRFTYGVEKIVLPKSARLKDRCWL